MQSVLPRAAESCPAMQADEVRCNIPTRPNVATWTAHLTTKHHKPRQCQDAALKFNLANMPTSHLQCARQATLTPTYPHPQDIM
jgi:hypothetical protein